jgi:predicted Ser/Thr protein kinase
MLGASVAGYRIEAVAGQGGMGVVYRARQLALDRAVALKLIAPELARDKSFRARFARESRIAASLDHPNVIPVYEAGEDGDRLFIAMRFVDGTDLARMLASDGALDPALAAELVAQAASALDAAHARGLVHRDVKPGNLLIDGDLARPHVYLTDFGLARRDGSSTALTTTGQWMGTPDYAAPEQIDGYDIDARTDVYALGCVLFAALTGRPPFGDRARMAKAGAHLHESPPTLREVRPGVPLAFEPVVARALAKQPEDRFATAGELGGAALAAARAPGATERTRRLRRRAGAAASGAVVAPRRPDSGRRTARLAGARGSRRRPIPLVPAALAVAAVAVTIAIAAALGAFSSDPEESPPPRAAVPATPPPPPDASPTAGAIHCSDTACTQLGRQVEPPIEGSPCRPQGRTGEWARVDSDGGRPLFACIPADSPPDGTPPLTTVPDVVEVRLDHAEKLLDRFGIGHDTSGGGALGVIDSGNWTVCKTTPEPGAALPADSDVKLFIDRSC